MTEYEVKCPQTWAWYTGFVHDYDMNDKKFYVTYPNDWKSGEWIDASSIRYKFDSASHNMSTWIPQENEEVECKARAEEREPYGWWPCKAKKYDDSDKDGGILYSVAFVGWGDQHNEILGGEYIRPKSKSKLLSIRNMNKDTYDVPNELKDWMSSQNNLFETLVPNRANNKLVHLKYDSSANKLTLIGTKRVLDTTKDIIYCFCEKQKTLLKLEEKTQEIEREYQLKKQREENAFKHTFKIHPLLSGYLRGRQGSNIKYVQQQLHKQIFSIKPQKDECRISAATKDALDFAVDQLQIVAKKVIIPSLEMGQIIGSQGQQIQDIKKKSQVIKIVSWYKWKNEEFHQLQRRHMQRYRNFDEDQYQNGGYANNDADDNETSTGDRIRDLIKNATKDNIFGDDDEVDLTEGYRREIDLFQDEMGGDNKDNKIETDALVVIGRKSRVEICVFMIEMTLTHFRTITKTRNNVQSLQRKISEITGNPFYSYGGRGRGGGRNRRGRGRGQRGGRGGRGRGRGRNRGRGRGRRYQQQQQQNEGYNYAEDDDQKDGSSPTYKRKQRGDRGSGGRGNRRYNNRRGGGGGGRRSGGQYGGGGGGYYGGNNGYYDRNNQYEQYDEYDNNQDYNYNNNEQQENYDNDNTQQKSAKKSSPSSKEKTNTAKNDDDKETNTKDTENTEQQQQPTHKRKRRRNRKKGKDSSNVQPSS